MALVGDWPESELEWHNVQCQQAADMGFPRGFSLCLPEFHKVRHKLSPRSEIFLHLGTRAAESGGGPQPGQEWNCLPSSSAAHPPCCSGAPPSRSSGCRPCPLSED